LCVVVRRAHTGTSKHVQIGAVEDTASLIGRDDAMTAPAPGPEGFADEEAEVRDALLDHSDERYNAWIFAQLDAAEARAAEELSER
jgi:hypothetical protein